MNKLDTLESLDNHVFTEVIARHKGGTEVVESVFT